MLSIYRFGSFNTLLPKKKRSTKAFCAIQDLYSDTLGQNLTLMGVTFEGGLNQNSDRNAVLEIGGTDPRRHFVT